YAGCWALPGGFIEEFETVEVGAARELKEETGLEGLDLELVGVYSNPDRDPRDRIITIAYSVVIDDSQMVVAGDDADRAEWHSLEDLPLLAFDHDRIIDDALVD
ncbi:MAG: NUDIX hydrolase, partial [Planctomycetota bacterium]